MGFEKDFEFEVVANPQKIKAVSVEVQQNLVENLDTQLCYENVFDKDSRKFVTVEYYEYDIDQSKPITTVEYEDGTVAKIDHTCNTLWNNALLISDQSRGNLWGIGKHTAYLLVHDHVVPFEVEIIPNPISGIELIKAPDKTEYIVGEHIDIDGAVVRINYTDGDYLDVELSKSRNFDFVYYDNKLEGFRTIQYYSRSFKSVGNRTLEIFLNGKFSCECTVTFKETFIESISISNSENNDLIITTHNSDGTTEDMKVLYLWSDDGGDCETEKHVGGWLVTDKGIFSGYFYYYYSGHHAVQLQFWDGAEYKFVDSNKLADCPWLDLYYKIPYVDVESVKPFNGKITADNVDLIALFSVICDEDYVKHPNYPYDDDSWRLKSEYDADYIAELIGKNFVTDSVDLSLSEKYNAEDNTIIINDKPLEWYGWCRILPMVYEEGYWYVEIQHIPFYLSTECDKSIYYVFDNELRFVAFSTEKMPVIEKPQAEIQNPTETVISYGDSIILHTDTSKIPEGGYIEWTASNENFDMEVSSDGSTCKISPKSKGDTTFTVTVYDAEGNPVSQDEQTMTSKAGFFDKIIAFFKKLFGLSKIFPQVYKNVF